MKIHIPSSRVLRFSFFFMYALFIGILRGSYRGTGTRYSTQHSFQNQFRYSSLKRNTISICCKTSRSTKATCPPLLLNLKQQHHGTFKTPLLLYEQTNVTPCAIFCPSWQLQHMPAHHRVYLQCVRMMAFFFIMWLNSPPCNCTH